MNRIKLFLLSDTLDALYGSPIGGAEKQILAFCQKINRERFELIVGCLSGPGRLLGEIAKLGIKTIRFDVRRIYDLNGIKKGIKFSGFLKKEKIDILMTYHFGSDMWGSIFAVLAGVPIIISNRRDAGFWKKPVHKIAYRLINRFIRKIIVVSKAIKETVLTQEKVSESAIELIYNGIDGERFSTDKDVLSKKQELGLPPQAFIIGCVGNIRPIKGHLYLVDAARTVLDTFSNTHFLFIGRNKARERLKQRVADLGLANNIHLLGMRNDIPELLAICDICVLPSLSEGLSNSLLEYMAAGKPIVATDAGGNPELIQHNANGLLAKKADAKDLAEKILHLLRNADEASRLALKAKETVTGKFTIETMIEKYECLFEELTHPTPAIILGLSANGLSIVRSLGRQGIPVMGISSSGDEAGLSSKFLKDSLVLPNPIYQENEFFASLIQLGKKLNQKAVLFPTADEYICVISKHRDDLSVYFDFPLPDRALVACLLDKQESCLLARDAGIPYPKTYLISDTNELMEISSQISYPCIIKPRLSHLWKEKYTEAKVAEARNKDELFGIYKKVRERGLEVIIQEIIPGPDSNVYEFMAYLDTDSKPLAYFTCRKLRQYPPGFGIGCLSESIFQPKIIELGLSFLKKIGYQGLVHIEFKIDSRTSQPVFLEANLRTSFIGELSKASGIDLPYIAYKNIAQMNTDKSAPTSKFKEGVKLLNFELDLGSFYRKWKNRELRVLDWIKSFYGKKMAHSYFAIDDIKPFLIVYTGLLKRIFIRLVSEMVCAITSENKNMGKPATAVILGMTANGLSVCRSLGRKGIPVIGIDSGARREGMFSRYCKPLTCPDVIKKESDFIDFLINLGQRFSQKAILYITGDEYLSVISKNRGALSAYFKFSLPDEWIIESFLNKSRSYEVAKENGLLCPKTYLINGIEDLERTSGQVQFPCILKPFYSHLWKIKYDSKKVAEIHSPKDLLESYARIRNDGQLAMVQEIIPGKDDQFFTFLAYFNRAHRPLAIFAKRKVRQYPIHYGIGSFHISEKNEDVVSLGLNFLSKIDYTGFAGIEFKRDSRDGKLKFMELNLRTLMSGELAIASGIDLPYLYYQDLRGAKVNEVFDFKEGIKLVNWELDIASFWKYRKLGELQFFEWLKSFQGKVVDEYFSWDDLAPFLFVCLRFTKNLLRKMGITLSKRLRHGQTVSIGNKECKDKIHILHLISSNGLYGAEKVMLQLGRQSNCNGTKAWVGAVNNSHNPHLEIIEEAKNYHLPAHVFESEGRFDLHTISTVCDFIRKNHIDLIHTHNYKANLLGLLAAKKAKIPIVATLHGYIGNGSKLKLYEKLDRFILRYFNKVILVDKGLRKRFNNGSINAAVINNGVDISSSSTHQLINSSAHQLTIGTVGRLSEEKGHRYLLEAFSKIAADYPDTRLLIVGDGELRKELENLSAALAISEKVIFAGFQNDVSKYYQQMDIYVSCSLVEHFPIAILEAMSFAKAIAATDVGGTKDLIKDKTTGLLINPGAGEEIYKAILTYIGIPSLRESLGENAYQFVRDNYSLDKMADAYQKVYRQLLNDEARPRRKGKPHRHIAGEAASQEKIRERNEA